MKAADPTTIITQWTTLGAGFNSAPAEALPDIERLLIATATLLSHSPKLFVMTGSWLARFGHLVAEDRLKHLTQTELSEQDLPGFGLLLESARTFHPRPPLKQVLALCKPAAEAGPLFEQSRKSPAFIALAKRRASPESLRWGCWADALEPKWDALMSMRWLLNAYPEMQLRAEYFGDLRASVLAAIIHEPSACASELALQRSIGHSRSGIRDALTRLELAAHIERRPVGACSNIRLLLPLAAA